MDKSAVHGQKVVEQKVVEQKVEAPAKPSALKAADNHCGGGYQRFSVDGPSGPLLVDAQSPIDARAAYNDRNNNWPSTRLVTVKAVI